MLKTYALVEAVQARAKDQYTTTAEQEASLREVWDRFKPDTPLVGIVSKQWQEVSRVVIHAMRVPLARWRSGAPPCSCMRRGQDRR